MKKKVALYSPYLDTLGGGEKYILEILKFFDNRGDQIYIFWDHDLSSEITKRLNISFNNLTLLHNIFKKPFNIFKKAFYLKNFDYFFYVTDGSYFISTAKHNFIYAMVPKKELYDKKIINKIKLFNYDFITHSKFTHDALLKWGLDSKVIFPYLDNNFIDIKIQTLKKDKIILSIGRFFSHLHSKRQDKIIELFNKYKQKHVLFKNFKLILAGGLKEEDKSYFNELKMLVKNNPDIIFKPNIPYHELLKLYEKASIYWHFAGYGVDPYMHPEAVEHLGITPLEAMAEGCIAFCYAAGGPLEYIDDGGNGFLFKTEEELFKKTVSLLTDINMRKKIMTNAKKFIISSFSQDRFNKDVEINILKK